MKTYFDENEYLAENGGGSLIGTGIFLQSDNSRGDSAQRELLRQLDILEEKNRELRHRMAMELHNGGARFMTPEERLRILANGHPDNGATHAARRCLAKRGISL